MTALIGAQDCGSRNVDWLTDVMINGRVILVIYPGNVVTYLTNVVDSGVKYQTINQISALSSYEDRQASNI